MAEYFRLGLRCQKEKHDSEEALKYYILALEAGWKAAKFHLNCMYSVGQDIERDDTKSIPWNKIILTNKEIDTLCEYYMDYTSEKDIQNNIGVLYHLYKKDGDRAIEYYTLAAEQGCAVAQSNLANVYKDRGQLEQALEWLCKLANKGNIQAMYDLGGAFRKKCYGKRNYLEAYKWYRMAAEKGEKKGYYWIAWMYQRGHMTGEPDHEKAAEYYRLADNLSWAQQQLAILHEEMKIHQDWPAERHYDEAHRLYLEAVVEEEDDIQYDLALFYYTKHCPYQNYTKALHYFKLASDQGYEDADYYLEIFRNLTSSLDSDLQSYVQNNPNTLMSYYFFCNFLLHINNTIEDLNWQDELIKPQVIKSFTDYFKAHNLTLTDETVEEWYVELYG